MQLTRCLFQRKVKIQSLERMHFSLNFVPQYHHLLMNIPFVMLMQYLHQNIHLANRNNNPLHGWEVLCLLAYLGFILNDLFLHLNNLKYFLHFLQMLCPKYFNFFNQISSFFCYDLINLIILFIKLFYFLVFIQLESSSLFSVFQQMILYFNYQHSIIQVIFQFVITIFFFILQQMLKEYRYSFVSNLLINFFNFE